MAHTTMPTLLAKAIRNGQEPKTLLVHTLDVLDTVRYLFGTYNSPTRLALAWLHYFGLDDSAFNQFLQHVRISAAAHDIGKANDGFQNAIHHNEPQSIWHEHLSGLLMAEREFDGWLQAVNLDAGIILASVISHHMRANEKSFAALLPGARNVVRILTQEADYETLWNHVESEVKSKCPTTSPFPLRWTAEDIAIRSKKFKFYLHKENAKLRDNPVRSKLLNAVRSALLVCDAVGSGVPRVGEDLKSWIDQSFPPLLTEADIHEKVIQPRIEQLRKRRRWDDSKGFSDYQRGMAHLGPRVLLTTPCGSGKTLAAWNWIAGQLRSHPASRVIFLYPTRGSATEGFRDYVSWAPEDEAGLLSGTANYDLQGLFQNPEDNRTGRDFRADPRLFALGYWRKRIFSATADQFLPFLQYNYGPMCLLPLLAESILVVDEVHSYDKSMFSSLTRFLETFPTPVLCMTATLSKERRSSLIEKCGLTPYPEAPPSDLVDIACHPRYRVEWIDRDKVKDFAISQTNNRKNVLWVVNRVNDCQSAFSEIRTATPKGSVFCYHSRFRLMDRRDRHNEIVQAFQDRAETPCSSGVLGIATQVCEMSLDLDSDILISELAPISSLIQRMGRCNRDLQKMLRGRVGKIYIIRRDNAKEKPYDSADLNAAESFVDELAGRTVSQAELEELYQQLDHNVVEPGNYCPFLDGGPYADAMEESFRDIDEFTVPTILDSDLPAVIKALDKKKPWDGFVVPVPKKSVDESMRPRHRRFPHWLSIASASCYTSLGGFDERLKNAQI